MLSVIIGLAATLVFSGLVIFFGTYLIDYSEGVTNITHRHLLNRGGLLLAWTGGLSVLLSLWEFVLWPWFSIREAYNRHKDNPTFMAALALGWCILSGLFVHAIFWSSS